MALPTTPCGVSYSLLPVYHMRKAAISQAEFLNIGIFFTVRPARNRRFAEYLCANARKPTPVQNQFDRQSGFYPVISEKFFTRSPQNGIL